MMRILHSLPRTHKLLLLPVATMVTVLGAHKIVSTLDDTRYEHDAAQTDTLLVPLDPDTSPGVPSLTLDRTPVSQAIDVASRAVDATREHVPLSQLTASEVVDIDFIDAAKAGRDSLVSMTDTPDSESTPPIDEGARHIAVVLGTVASGMLASNRRLLDDATSYEDVSEAELELFDEGPIILEEEIAANEPFVPEWQTYTVQPGDTFTVLAQERFGMGYSEVMALLDEMPEPKLLTQWNVGTRFDYQLNAEGKLATLRIMSNPRDGYLVKREDGDTEVSTIERAGEATQRLFAGTVSGSFARSAQATGLTSSEVSELSHVLEKKLDFRRDTRRGDRFEVLVESDIIDGESLDPRIQAVRYDGSRMDLTLIRNPQDNQFYTPDGQGLNPSFNRYPFEGHYRISSPFNPRRHHPVTGRISPHKGTDFAMPVGTAVKAPANGRVEKVGNHPAAGRYIVIRHDNGYKTRYLHLSKPLVSRGDRVTMGERIALSGNTGRSTGPHLHYEVLVDNNQVNAMKVALPEGGSLSGQALASFKQQAEPVLAALDSGQTGTVVASTQAKDEDDDEG
ncbi:peptidoglycan DD-metalloendopeptidase family protein [Halomonas elongata]|uniref:Peptidase M23 family protein n=1 Tax=Halomonas elongata (strain ATCC 33173 / DSM 2581 / NBRC 15536 / NCIMB 2198 / 1H9) TaxID=768066 RepID=E1V5C6_HALED|nr:peptidoglycan DD-metalloendopeptidase family protein [Halomonas elongata]MDL4864389.1 peptidoglycan DD-metalloendopeptidase family protein [Halomonas elongata]WBF16822.1 peptidoglycan DD-metalloendopeptidase family protein [Halomonas elongata]WPU45653.1 peptidoglycan DD-metalloendopeptidase family protein [Halomonas elongata DSM 2581]CBV43081.1 peptidase M23 family protein [Halomonas elongata DSM 2581]